MVLVRKLLLNQRLTASERFMMVEHDNYYRQKGVMAPYRRPVSSANREKPGFLNKLKSFFAPSDNCGKQGSYGFKRRRLATEESPPVPIPGSFVTPSDVSSIILPKRQEPPKICDSTVSTKVDAFDDDTEKDVSIDNDGSYNADTSNAKLADFFSRKGGEPLNEVEMEGVNTLMKKSRRSRRSSRASSTANTSLNHNDPAELVYSRVLKRPGASSLTASTTRAPSFAPRYDGSFRSHSFSNGTGGTVSSRRRVFNYSSLPSPYKTTVYKYSAADSHTGDLRGEIEEPSIARSMICKSNGGKRLSNTASALVSLLDSDNSKEDISNQLANPYSSHVSQLRRYKRSLPALPKVRQETFKDTPKKSPAVQELGNVQAKPTSEIASKCQRYNSGDRYKPMRSSSLRSNVLKAEESSERNPPKVAEPEVPRASTFNFAFQPKAVPDTKLPPQPPHSAFNTELAFKFQPQKIKPSIKSGSTIDDEISEKTAHGQFATPTVSSPGLIAPHYDFGQVAPSNVDPSGVDNKKVQDFKTLFAF